VADVDVTLTASEIVSFASTLGRSSVALTEALLNLTWGLPAGTSRSVKRFELSTGALMFVPTTLTVIPAVSPVFDGRPTEFVEAEPPGLTITPLTTAPDPPAAGDGDDGLDPPQAVETADNASIAARKRFTKTSMKMRRQPGACCVGASRIPAKLPADSPDFKTDA
jgi:hypothetical protein